MSTLNHIWPDIQTSNDIIAGNDILKYLRQDNWKLKQNRARMGPPLDKKFKVRSKKSSKCLRKYIQCVHKVLVIIDPWPRDLHSRGCWILNSRAAPSVEAHHCVHGPNTGRNSGGRRINFFLMLALFRRASFWPPSMVYISVIITHLLATEWQSHRVTESQTLKGTQFTGGWNFFVPDFNELPYTLCSQGDNNRKPFSAIPAKLSLLVFSLL